jgi:hypothetical protein
MINVCRDLEAIVRAVSGTTCVVEQARGPSYFGERGEARDHWNLTTCSSKNVLAQADSPGELVSWGMKNGAKRVMVIR